MRRNVIRALRRDEPIPDTTPKRYRNAAGYVRLRWLIGPQTYVEEYEHRVVAGRPDGDVHHVNGIKSDNRPENLVVLTREEHALLHQQERRDPTRFGGYRGAEAQAKAARAEARRVARRELLATLRAAYEAGETTPQLAERFGLSPDGVSRALRQAGCLLRSPARPTGPAQQTRQLVHARAQMRCERCDRNVAWEGHEVHHRRPRAAGGSRRADTNQASNLVLLCRGCHRHIEEHPAEAFATGFRVPQGHDPAVVPLTYRDGTPVLLDDHGHVHLQP
jgi:hypothetical protein